ncbi:MAG: hypothetical protein P8M25_00480 [Paracoccaceae bacterium]|nr:hypothetical protein [Paracoccaceae bacterium]
MKSPFLWNNSSSMISDLYAKMKTDGTTLAFAGNEASQMTGLAIIPNDHQQVAAS